MLVKLDTSSPLQHGLVGQRVRLRNLREFEKNLILKVHSYQTFKEKFNKLKVDSHQICKGIPRWLVRRHFNYETSVEAV